MGEGGEGSRARRRLAWRVGVDSGRGRADRLYVSSPARNLTRTPALAPPSQRASPRASGRLKTHSRSADPPQPRASVSVGAIGSIGSIGSIGIYNGTETRGLAAAARTALEQRGYRVTQIGDVAEATPHSRLLLRGNKRAFAEQLARDLGISGIAIIAAPNAPGDADVVLVLGADYSAAAP